MVLQHEVMLSARSVGGPLFTLEGKFLGMNIAAANRVESYAIPVENLSELFQRLKDKASIK
jgi:S1-C subfamily serine protease